MRPMAASREAMEDLKRILAGRSAFYSKADLHFNTSGQSVDDAFDALRTQVREVLGIL
ncbi:anaerobic benzoate catabolism transcriptional regulator [Hydrogenophaga sp. T4]|nr:anaerobic benzoate catabolism transcriptional regulator [Hydrogenophaga sp. T4]